jgi:hypothetical protein
MKKKESNNVDSIGNARRKKQYTTEEIVKQARATYRGNENKNLEEPDNINSGEPETYKGDENKKAKDKPSADD